MLIFAMVALSFVGMACLFLAMAPYVPVPEPVTDDSDLPPLDCSQYQ
jgi:hypothetical protein